jgi:putative peptidoglycan lipid II flippase
LPTVLRYLWPLAPGFGLRSENVTTIVTNFFPVFLSRGVVQISAYIDSLIASFLPTGAVSALSYAQTLYSLPVSLFGMAISAAELPAMSSALGTTDEIAAVLRQRLARSLERIAFFVIPSAVAFVVLGDVIVATIYRSGRFGHSDVIFVWGVLAGSAVGLLASTSGRLFSSAFYALRNTRTPLNFALIRVVLTLALGYFFALPLPRLLHIDQRWGVAGLTLSAGISGWVEFVLLRRALQHRIGAVPYALPRIAKMWLSALIAAAIAYGIKRASPFHKDLLIGPAVLLPYGAIYLLLTQWLKVSAAGDFANRILRRTQ